jgi:excisionase family DNA binding protein
VYVVRHTTPLEREAAQIAQNRAVLTTSGTAPVYTQTLFVWTSLEMEQIAGTIREAAKRFGLGEKLLRMHVRRGEIPSYTAGCKWSRVLFSDVERWLKSTRVPVTKHAEERVAELEREGRL